jgi:hypothetical protein
MAGIEAAGLFGRSAVQPPEVLTQELAGELVFLNLRTESYFALDRTGSAMYREVVAGPTIDDALGRLRHQFAADPDTLQQDLRALVERCLSTGLLRLDG